MENRVEFRGGWKTGFIPIIIFIFFCILYFIIFKVFEMYALAAGAFVSLIIGGIFTKKNNYEPYWNSIYKGVSEAIPLIIILFIIGMFSTLIKSTNISSGFLWLAYALGVKGGLFTAFTFLAVCIISTATGSSIGTMFTCFPIFYPAGVLLGSNPALLAGGIVSGAIFGDNLAPISDTTIISAATQEYSNREGFAEIGGCVSSRLRYSLIAGTISFILFWIFGGNNILVSDVSDILKENMNPISLVMLIPVTIMLITSVKTRNIYKAITIGIITGVITGLSFGLLSFNNIISVDNGMPVGFIADGINSMMPIVTLVISVYGIMGVLNGAGILEKITDTILNSKLCKTPGGTEIAMMLGISITTLLFGGVTSASMATFGKVQNEIGKGVGLHPYRRANLLDGFANSIVLTVPFLSVFTFLGSLLSAGYESIPPLSPTQVGGGMIYCMMLFVVLLFSVITGFGRQYEGLNGDPVNTPTHLSNLKYKFPS